MRHARAIPPGKAPRNGGRPLGASVRTGGAEGGSARIAQALLAEVTGPRSGPPAPGRMAWSPTTRTSCRRRSSRPEIAAWSWWAATARCTPRSTCRLSCPSWRSCRLDAPTTSPARSASRTTTGPPPGWLSPPRRPSWTPCWWSGGGRSTYSLEALSAGLQADARGRYQGQNSADLGAGAHALAQAMRAYEPYPVDLELDGQPAFAGRAGQVFLANMPFFGFGFKVDPFADPSRRPAGGDRARGAVARLGGDAADVGLPGPPPRACRRARQAGRHARLTGPLPMAADGEPLGIGSAAVTVEHGRLRIAASEPPRGAPWQA